MSILKRKIQVSRTELLKLLNIFYSAFSLTPPIQAIKQGELKNQALIFDLG